MLFKKNKYYLRKLTIGLVSLSMGVVSVGTSYSILGNSQVVFANEITTHSNNVQGSNKDWGTLIGNTFIVDYNDTSMEMSKSSHSSLTENFKAIRIPEKYSYEILVNGQKKH